MVMSHAFWLLAACTTFVIAGPIPRQYKDLHYPRFANTSLILSMSVSDALAASVTAPTSSTLLLESASDSSLSPSTITLATSTINTNPLSAIESSTPNFPVDAKGDVSAIPLIPIVVTSIRSAMSFQFPNGQPAGGIPAETFISTIFSTFTGPFPSEVSQVTSELPTEGQPPATSTQTESTTGTAFSTSRGQTGQSEATTTTTQPPKFTYDPTSDESGLMPTSTGLPAEQPEQSTIVPEPTTLLSSQINNATSTNVPTASSAPIEAPSLTTTSSKPLTFVIVTKTEFTTVYPTPSTTAEPQPEPPVTNTDASTAQSSNAPTNTNIITPSAPQDGEQPAASSTLAGLPSTPLPLPPVIITYYTTVTPPAELTQEPATSASTPSNSPSDSAPAPSEPTTALAAPTSTAEPAPSSAIPSELESSQAAPRPTPLPSNSPPPTSAPAPTSSSSTAVIVVPIPSSLIITVTVTEKQTDTVTVTTTVTS